MPCLTLWTTAVSLNLYYEALLQHVTSSHSNLQKVFDAMPLVPSEQLRTLIINGYLVKTFSPEWILHEKILSQYQRQGPKAQTDIHDVECLIIFAVPGMQELEFGHIEELKAALTDLLKKWPGMQQALK